RVPVLLAAPAPVSAGLLGADPSLFNQGDRNAALGQVVGRKDTEDAAADHDDVSGGRRPGGSVDMVQRRGHDESRSSLSVGTGCRGMLEAKNGFGFHVLLETFHSVFAAISRPLV